MECPAIDNPIIIFFFKYIVYWLVPYDDYKEIMRCLHGYNRRIAEGPQTHKSKPIKKTYKFETESYCNNVEDLVKKYMFEAMKR